MKTVYDTMSKHIDVNGVTVTSVWDEDGEDSGETVTSPPDTGDEECENCKDELAQEKEKNANLQNENDALKQQLADLQEKSHNSCQDVENQLEQCKSEKETCQNNLESCTSGNSDACNTCQGDLEQCQNDKEECNSDLQTCTSSSGQNDECQVDLTECESKLTECNAGSDRCNACESDLTKCQADLANAEDDCNNRIATCQGERDTCNAEKEECNNNLFSCTSNNKCIGGLAPIGHDDFDTYRENMDWKLQMNWMFYWVDIIHSDQVKNVIFARIPLIKSDRSKCKDIGMVLATVRMMMKMSYFINGIILMKNQKLMKSIQTFNINLLMVYWVLLLLE
jgi:chromosome segregation ATPase